VAESRRYQLQNEAANRLIGELVDVAGVPPERRGLVQQMLTTVLKLHEDGAGPGDLKINNTALKELRYAYKVFAPYKAVRKVTVFGSARTAGSEAAALTARDFGRRMVQEGWMVVTGAGAGIMGAAQEGAGGEQSFGLNIRLPFEQEANPWIASDPKLITFKYFFTRKLFLVKEASAVVLFPGGFGTMDECFELLTLMQTGKAEIVPVVLVETGPKPYWRIWDRFVQGVLVDRRTSHHRVLPRLPLLADRRRQPRPPAQAPAVPDAAARPARRVRGHPEGAARPGPGSGAAGGQRVPRAVAAHHPVQPLVLLAPAPLHRPRERARRPRH
jgi:uncharacterized protein (TIGR00730 family)